jgi:long-chain acyl-CoA synthetase
MPRSFTTLLELVQFSVEDFGPRELFGTKQADGTWKWLNYSEFGQQVDAARAGLAALGVSKGDRVAMVSDNRVEWAVMAFATYGLGACFVPMYEAQKSEEWEFILDDCQAKVAVGATEAIYTQLKAIASTQTQLQHVVGLSLDHSNEDSYQHVLNSGRSAPVAPADVKPSDLASFIYTSGTTGAPKGVKLSHANLSQNVQRAGDRFEFTKDDRSLAFLPWAHVFGIVAELCTFLHFGCAMAINDEVPQLLNNLPQVRPTVLVAVPRIFNRIYDGVNKQMTEKPALIQALFRSGVRAATKKNSGERLGFFEGISLSLADKLIFSKVRMKFGGRLRFVVSGSAALNPRVAEFIDALGIEVYEGYGLTETSPVVSVNYKGHRKIGSIGKVIEGVTVRIDTSATGDSKSGEIIVSGHNVMQGYHNREEENSKAFCEDGSFRTGDMGYIDEDGFIFITGRIKEQYKLETGKYVVPSPLEEDLKLSPFVANVMLYGANRPYNVALVVPDLPAVEKWAAAQGLALGDVTKSKEVNDLLLAELQKFGRGFKSYEVPRKLTLTTEDFTTENNMLTPSLKLKRRNVLERYEKTLEALY